MAITGKPRHSVTVQVQERFLIDGDTPDPWHPVGSGRPLEFMSLGHAREYVRSRKAGDFCNAQYRVVRVVTEYFDEPRETK